MGGSWSFKSSAGRPFFQESSATRRVSLAVSVSALGLVLAQPTKERVAIKNNAKRRCMILLLNGPTEPLSPPHHGCGLDPAAHTVRRTKRLERNGKRVTNHFQAGRLRRACPTHATSSS